LACGLDLDEVHHFSILALIGNDNPAIRISASHAGTGWLV
jgi:hypothetical protein